MCSINPQDIYIHSQKEEGKESLNPEIGNISIVCQVFVEMHVRNDQQTIINYVILLVWLGVPVYSDFGRCGEI